MKKIIYSFIVLSILLSPFSISIVENTKYLEIRSEIAFAADDSASSVEHNPNLLAEFLDFGIWEEAERYFATGLLLVSGAIVFYAGVVLNYAFEYTILNISAHIASFEVINGGWSAFRDIANIFFIFILIYIAVSTILSLDSRATQKTLVKIIVVALLINFSLFFTKVIIDTSNVVTIQFYNAIAPSSVNQSADIHVPLVETLNGGISWTFMQPMFLASIYDIKGVNNEAAVDKLLQKEGQNILIVGLMGSIFMLIAAFVFFAIALLLVIRFVILIFLMVLSPLAYVGSILPGAEGMAKKWWKTLMDQIIFAPVLMMMLWFTAKVLYSPAFQSLTKTNRDAGTGLIGSVTSGDVGTIAVIFNFIIVIVFLVASLIFAKGAGATGGAWAVKFAKAGAGAVTAGAIGWAGRNTIGRASEYASEKLKDTPFASSKLGTLTLRGTRSVAKQSFDARGVAGAKDLGLGSAAGAGGYNKTITNQIKSKEDYAKSLGNKPVFANDAAKQAYQKLDKNKKSLENDLDAYDKMIAEAVVINDYKAVESYKKEKTKIEAALKTNEKGMARFSQNKYLGATPQLAYASSIGDKKTGLARAIPGNWWVGQKSKRAAKKIRDSAKKNPEKKLKDALAAYGPTTTGGATPPPPTGTPPPGGTPNP